MNNEFVPILRADQMAERLKSVGIDSFNPAKKLTHKKVFIPTGRMYTQGFVGVYENEFKGEHFTQLMDREENPIETRVKIYGFPINPDLSLFEYVDYENANKPPTRKYNVPVSSLRLVYDEANNVPKKQVFSQVKSETYAFETIIDEVFMDMKMEKITIWMKFCMDNLWPFSESKKLNDAIKAVLERNKTLPKKK